MIFEATGRQVNMPEKTRKHEEQIKSKNNEKWWTREKKARKHDETEWKKNNETWWKRDKKKQGNIMKNTETTMKNDEK